MSVEPRRGCGFRKVGGLYLVGGGTMRPCDRLPILLTICPTCGHGFKQSRGWTWLDLPSIVTADHETFSMVGCKCESWCPLCHKPESYGRCGLLWIGEKFYPRPTDFITEGNHMGYSRRIGAIPRGFKVGETWVLFAHAKAAPCPICLETGMHKVEADSPPVPCAMCETSGKQPGIFMVWKPVKIEQIITTTQSQDPAFMASLEARNITAVVVPDNDPDHRGSVYDDAEENNGESDT